MLETFSNWVALNVSEEASTWFQYFTNGKHLAWYASFRFTLLAALFVCSAAMAGSYLHHNGPRYTRCVVLSLFPSGL